LAGEELVVNIIGNASKLKSELEKASTEVNKFATKVKSAGKTMTVIGGAITAVSIGLVKMASDAEETSSKFATVFRDVSEEAEKTAKNLADSFGLSSNKAKQLLADTGDLLTGFGFTGEAALDLATKVNELAVDLASFTNYSGGAEGASAALTKALLGERESLKSLGISILEADVKSKVLELRQKGITFETERQAKAYATLLIAQEQSKNAIGDFSRTSESFANQMRILKARLSDVAIELGDKLLPIATELIGKAKDIVEKISIWIKENAELTEKIVKWAAGLGAVLAVLGPIAVILPSLITGITLLSEAFLPFAVTGGIVLGIKKLSEYLRDTVGGMREFREELDKLTLKEIDKQIEELTKSAEQLQKRFYEIPKGIGRQEIRTMLDEINERLEMLYERREKLTKAEKEGIEVSEEKRELDEEIAKGQETINKLLEDWNEKLKLYTKYTDEATDIQLDLLDGMYRYTQVAKEWKQVSLYFMGTRDSLKAVEKATDEVTVSEETMAKATGKVYDKWYELAKLWDVRPDLQKYFITSSKALKEFGNNSKEVIKTSWEKWKEFFDNLKQKAGTTMTILQDGIEEFISGFKTGLSNAISSLLNMGKTNSEIKEQMAEENTNFTEEMAKLEEEYNQAKMAGDDEAAANAIQKMRDIKEEHAKTMQALQDQLVTPKTVWEQFWESLKQSAINALADIIASWAWKAITGFVGWILPFNKGGGIGYALGGAVKMATGGIAKKIKGYQSGGLTDTVPAMLTPGEYVISKPMVDAIKRFKAIPSNLIEAISRGLPTPVPAFATGGPVGTPNIASTAGFGTNINVYISGNNISNEIDLKHLANKVSDEIVRKLNQRRRY